MIAFAEYKFFTVFQRPVIAGRKTRQYLILNNRTGVRLGEIEWYPNWRQFAMTPVFNSIWSAGCLADIQDAIAKISEAHKKESEQ